jgi:hypothetical protein
MKNLITFENFSMGDHNMRTKEEMKEILCNNGYTTEECDGMTYDEMCQACDDCDKMEMAQTFEARKSAKKSTTKNTVTKKDAQEKLKNGKKLTDTEIAAMSGNPNQKTKGDFIEIAKFNAQMKKESQPETKKTTTKKK